MYSYLFKYIIVGDSGCGKSCILLQYTNENFEPVHDLTIGVEFGTKVITIPDSTQPTSVKLQIWDTAGQESFRSITRSYYRNSAVAIVVFDITRRHTFEQIEKWLTDITDLNKSMTILIVGNKIDLHHRRQVSTEEGEKLARKYNCTYLETSAKTGHNINTVFEFTAKTVYNQILSGSINMSLDSSGIKLCPINYNNQYKIIYDSSENDSSYTNCYDIRYCTIL